MSLKIYTGEETHLRYLGHALHKAVLDAGLHNMDQLFLLIYLHAEGAIANREIRYHNSVIPLSRKRLLYFEKLGLIQRKNVKSYTQWALTFKGFGVVQRIYHLLNRTKEATSITLHRDLRYDMNELRSALHSEKEFFDNKINIKQRRAWNPKQ